MIAPVLLACALGAATAARAEFAINETTTGDQRRPHVDSDAAGNFVVVWASDDPAPGYNPEIFARRFDSAGLALGTEFQISSDARDFERDPKVAVSDGGRFMIVWSGFSDGQFNGVFARRYDDAGNAVTAEFIVNSYTTDSQLNPEIEAIGDDTFIVAWTGFGDRDGSDSGIFARRFDPSGPVGTEFQINAYTTGAQHEPKIARVNAMNDFVVMWEDDEPYAIKARRFSAAGTALGDESIVVDPILPAEIDGMDGGFVVVWGLDSMYGQRFADDGTALGTAFTVFDSPFARHVVDPPAVASADSGAFLVTWSNTETFGRRYSSDGEAVGEPFMLNEFTTGVQGRPIPAPLEDEDFVVVWHSFDQDGQGYGVFGRRFTSGAVDCPLTPAAGGACRNAGESRLIVRNGSPDNRDILKFHWFDGAETTLAALGDPPNTTPYSACLFVDETLIHEMPAPSATLCGGRPCWRPLSGNGFRYRNRAAANDAAAEGGTERVIMRAGAAGSSRVFLKARGAELQTENLLPVAANLPVIVQVHSISGECWGASFDPTAFLENGAAQFKARNRP